MTDWDYSGLAEHYDSRADYAAEAIDLALSAIGLSTGDAVADIGAGTGKLARPMAERGLVVHAVEPNTQMRTRGIRNTAGLAVTSRRRDRRVCRLRLRLHGRHLSHERDA